MNINFNEFKILFYITVFLLIGFYAIDSKLKETKQINKIEEKIKALNKENIESIDIDSIYGSYLEIQFPLKITNKDSISRIINYIKKGKDYKILGHPQTNRIHHMIIKSKKGDLIMEVWGSNIKETYILFKDPQNRDIKTMRNDSLGIYINSGKSFN